MQSLLRKHIERPGLISFSSISAALVSLAFVSSPTDAAVWQAMIAVQTTLLFVSTCCFGRLLLAVFRVRRDTLRSQMLRHQFVMEEKRSYFQSQEGPALALADGTQAPVLPPIKTNRWLISKTFLKAKASSAANTVATSLHRRSQSGPYLGRPSTTSEVMPRPSNCSSTREPNTADANTPFGFLQYDPAVTSRFGHFRHLPVSQAELQPTTPRSITFSAQDGRATSPLPDGERVNGIHSRLTDHSRISGDAPRPSMGSFMSTDSGSTELHGPASYLGAGRLFANNGRNTTLSRREARRAGARMGGHLLGCVASWTLVLPFLVYKIGRPDALSSPFYSLLLVSLGVSLSGPLLAVQTALADGFWYKRDLPPLMASSSAVAFEHLESRANTPAFAGKGAAQLAPAAKSPTLPNSATTEATATSGGTHHRSNESRGSSSSISLASIAAFSNPAPGTFHHSSDTREAPTSIVAKALYMAAPHPKLHIVSRGTGSSGFEQARHTEAQAEEQDWKKKEARKLKSFS